MTDILAINDHLSADDNGVPWSDGMSRMYKAFMSERGINTRNAVFHSIVPTESTSFYRFFGKREDGVPYMRMWRPGKYLRAEYKSHLDRTWELINQLKPNLILACGELAMFTLTSGLKIEQYRGRITTGNSAIPGRKVLCTYSPRDIVRDWKLRPVLLADLEKAGRECTYPEIRRPQRFIHIHPALTDLDDFFTNYIKSSSLLSVDIEVAASLITCVGIGTDSSRAIVVPFYDPAKPKNNYWPSVAEEIRAWRWIRKVLNFGIPVLGQNYLYDIQYLWKTVGIPNRYAAEDTLLMHHAMQPELRKGLGFLGSVYTEEGVWKTKHKAANDRTGKKEDD